MVSVVYKYAAMNLRTRISEVTSHSARDGTRLPLERAAVLGLCGGHGVLQSVLHFALGAMRPEACTTNRTLY